MHEDIEEALVKLLESQHQAQYDFGGEQRDWHLPRLNDAAIIFMTVFPLQAGRALMRVKNPDGELVHKSVTEK